MVKPTSLVALIIFSVIFIVLLPYLLNIIGDITSVTDKLTTDYKPPGNTETLVTLYEASITIYDWIKKIFTSKEAVVLLISLGLIVLGYELSQR